MRPPCQPRRANCIEASPIGIRARSSAGEHYLDMVGVTGSIPVAPTIFLDFPPNAGRGRDAHFVPVMLTITEQGNGVSRIAGDCFSWFAGRDDGYSGCRRVVGKVRFDCVTPNKNDQALENDARVADALIAIEQVDLLGRDFPLTIELAEAVTRPPGQHTDFIVPEFADDEIRADHSLIVSAATEDFDICDKARGSRRGGLRPGVSSPQAIDSIFKTTAIVEHDSDLAPGIAAVRC